ncbi:MAG: hypothetical protein CM15mP84_00580 [Cellvibrionales bacterium]|nr:MAG: hypothetical protein CM15mP84_00580 [Cellvibrionales bacterium]
MACRIGPYGVAAASLPRARRLLLIRSRQVPPAVGGLPADYRYVDPISGGKVINIVALELGMITPSSVSTCLCCTARAATCPRADYRGVVPFLTAADLFQAGPAGHVPALQPVAAPTAWMALASHAMTTTEPYVISESVPSFGGPAAWPTAPQGTPSPLDVAFGLIGVGLTKPETPHCSTENNNRGGLNGEKVLFYTFAVIHRRCQFVFGPRSHRSVSTTEVPQWSREQRRGERHLVMEGEKMSERASRRKGGVGPTTRPGDTSHCRGAPSSSGTSPRQKSPAKKT